MDALVARSRAQWLQVAGLAALALAALALFLLWGLPVLQTPNVRLASYMISLRLPKLAGMLLAALAIGAATMVFQSLINNTVVTPCLLGMNALYTVVQTALVFLFGMGSVLYTNTLMNFGVNLAVMCVLAIIVYGYLFKLTRSNVLYVLLIGTVLTGAFGSIQSTIARIMDPNDYDALLTQLVASFNNMNTALIVIAALLLALLCVGLVRELAVLDVLSLGKNTAVNLGISYEKTQRRLLLGVVLAIAIATALVGPVSFLGLILANVARGMLKTYRHAQLVSASMLIGVIALVASQLIVERIFVFAVPISVFITVAGGIYFLTLLLRPERYTS